MTKTKPTRAACEVWADAALREIYRATQTLPPEPKSPRRLEEPFIFPTIPPRRATR